MIKRRIFIVGSVAILAAPLVGQAQHPRKVHRLGIAFSGGPLSVMLGPNPSSPSMKGFLQGLRDLGYVDGQNLMLVRRAAEGKYERLPDIMSEFIRLKVDLIVAGGNPATAAAKAATTTIPIVAGGLSYPVEAGLIASLAWPGGNITGLAFFAELNAKQLEIVKEVVPKGSPVVVLRYAPEPIHAAMWRETQIAGQRLGMELQSIEIRDSNELETTFSLIATGRARGLMILPSALLFSESRRIASLTMKHRLPAISEFREFVEAGGLLSYGANIFDMWQHIALFVDRILKGAKPADLPVEQPTKFELVINMRTAKALGLTIPQSLLLRADEIIE